MNRWSIKKVFFTLTLLSVLFTSLYLTLNYLYIQSIVKENLQQKSLIKAYQVSKKMAEMHDSIALKYTQYEHHMYQSLQVAQEYIKKHGKNTSLQELKKRLEKTSPDVSYNIYIISKDYIVQRTTYKPDLGLDFHIVPNTIKVLEHTFHNPNSIDLSDILNDTVANDYKRYIVQRAESGEFLIQLGLSVNHSSIIDEYIKKVSVSIPNLLDTKVFVSYLIDDENVKVESAWAQNYKNLNKSYAIQSNVAQKQFMEMFNKNNEVSDTKLKEYIEHFANSSKYKNVYDRKNGKLQQSIIMPFFSFLNTQEYYHYFILIEFDESEAEVTIDRLNYLMLFLSLLFSLFVTSVLILMHKRILSPIEKLKTAMKSKQSFDIVSKASSDEVTQMSRIYNQLLDDLQCEIISNEELLEQFKVFTSNAIHQVRTPISVIKIAIEMIDTQDKEAILQVQSSLVTIDHIYDSLAFTLQEDSIKLPAKMLNISQVLQERIAIFDVVVSAHDIKIVSNIGMDITVNINQMELEFLIDNNISNAIKYGTPHKDINISLSLVSNEVIFLVGSSGKHIEDKEIIFQRYYRSDNTKRGSGIGLHMVKTICERNNILIDLQYVNEENIFNYYIPKM